MGKEVHMGETQTAPTIQAPITPLLLPECFAALSTAVEALDVFLDTQEHDWSPVILTQPPSCRQTRRESLESTLARLDAQQAELQRTIESLSVAQQKLRRQHGMCKSALSPVSALPYDVLRCIFDWDFDTASQMRFTKAVSAVCRDWRNVACDIPHLWGAFAIETLECLQHVWPWLKRSGSNALMLNVDIDELESPSWYKRVDMGIRIMFQTRVTELEWQGPDTLSLFMVGLFNMDGKGVIFDSLHKLSIGGPWYGEVECDEEDLVVDMEKLVFPKLQRLSLAVPVIDANEQTFPELKYLDVTGVTFENEQWDFLQYVPKLDTLTVNQMKSLGISYLDEIVATEHFILDELSINESDQGTVTTILRLLEMPNLTTISIDVSDMGHEPPYSPWGYNPPNDDAGHLSVPHLSNRLYHLVKSCPKLIELNLAMPMGCIRAVVAALDSPDSEGAFPAPDLTHLELLFRPTQCDDVWCPNENHIKQEAYRLGERLVSVLQHRKSAGYENLATLSISKCAKDSKMKELADRTQFTECTCQAKRDALPSRGINMEHWHDYAL